MKKYLLSSLLVLGLALYSTVAAWAENVVYGISPSNSFGARTTSFDIDALGSDALKLTPEFTFDTAEDFNCGTSVGDKYYAFVVNRGVDGAAFVTINFTSGKMVVVNDKSFTYGKPGFGANGMAYDEVNEKLYVIEGAYDESLEATATKLYAVETTTGTLTEVATWKDSYEAIASDHKGGFYLVKVVSEGRKNYPVLYKVSADFKVSEAVANNTLTCSYTTYNSLVASKDGNTVYYAAGKSIYAFDVAAGTVEKKGDLSMNIAGITFDKSSADGVVAEITPEAKPAAKRFLVMKRIYGSAMGDVPDDVDSKRTFYYYNVDGKEVGYANYGRLYSDLGVSDNFNLVDIAKPVFDENGNIVARNTYQWGPYDFLDYTFQKTPNCETYAYNEAGQLIADTTSVYYHEYTYNENGTLAILNTYNKFSKKLSQSIKYTYDEKGNVISYVSDGNWDSQKYNADIEYDENGNKVLEFQYQVVEDPNMPGETMNKSKQLEKWEYVNNGLALYQRFRFDDKGNEVPDYKTVYEPVVEGDYNDVYVRDSSYFDNGKSSKWMGESTYSRYTYVDFTDMEETTYMTLTAEVDAKAYNTVNLKFNMPQLAYMQDSKYVIYRDCAPIDTLSFNDFVENADPETGICTYQDKLLKNGTYDYFIQPLFTAYSDDMMAADLDEPGIDDGGVVGPEENPEAEWIGYYSTTPVQVTVYTELPAVTDLALTGGKVETSGTIANLQKTYYAGLSWKNPENITDYGFKKNSVYLGIEGQALAEITKADSTNANVELAFEEDTEAYVVTSYALGNAISDTITVKIKDIEAFATGVEGVTVDGAVKATFAGNTITLSDNATVSVFAANGQKVYEKNNVTSVSLNNLPAAAYIVCVEKNGNVNAYKYRVK
mgnify:FL=1